MIKLKVENTQLKGKSIKLHEGFTIGSAKESGVRAQHESMRPLHARFIEEEPDRFFVEIVDKEAHIFINGKDALRSELRHNDILKVGPLRFRVIDSKASSPNASRLDELLNKFESDEAQEVYDFAREDLFYLTTKDPFLRKRISFTIPSKDRFIDSAQSFLSRLVRQSGIDEMKLEAFMTCSKELILNAHRHGHKYDESKSITLQYRDLGDSVELVITDMGPGFDHRKILDEVRKQSAAQAARQRYQSGGFGGLGFQMISRLADKLKYNDLGNVVTMTINKSFE
jgi:anti-sigma regulatory factor (Ser/Thr protein kinase)